MLSIKQFISIFAVIVTGTLVSCNKDSNTYSPPGDPVVWGKLSAIKQQHVVISGPDTIFKTSEIAAAEFISDISTPSLFADAGTVRINDINLDRSSGNQYLKAAMMGQSPATLNMSDNIQWNVSGNGAVPPVSFNDVDTFPSYNLALPYTISRNTGLDLVFDSTTVSHADSVRVLIDDAQGHVVQRTFGANVGAVNLPASLLASLSLVSDQTAVVSIMPYAGIVKPFRNKGMHFIRETRIYQSVFIVN